MGLGDEFASWGRVWDLGTSLRAGDEFASWERVCELGTSLRAGDEFASWGRVWGLGTSLGLRKSDVIFCPKCPATGIACIDFIIRGKFSGNVNVGRIF